MKPYNEREKSKLLSKEEIKEIENIKNEIMEFIKNKTYAIPYISIDIQLNVTDSIGDIVIRDRYLSLL